MKLSALISKLEIIEQTAPGEMEIRDISYDSRFTEKGDVFVAISGFETDGHHYIKDAVEKGAVLVICERKPDISVPYVLVGDARFALAEISAAYFDYPAEKMQMIGVTGTNGKTTTTILLKNVLEACLGGKIGLIGTNDIQIGKEIVETERTTPESYVLQKLLHQMQQAGCSHVVMEVSSHALALHRVAGITYTVSVFTNLSQDHLDFHKTMDAYAKAKAALFAQSKVGIINIDDSYAPIMQEVAKKSNCEVLSYSIKQNEADLMAKDIRLKPEGISFSTLIPGEILRVALPIPGEFSVYNALAVIGASLKLGLGLNKVSQALEAAGGVKGRVEAAPTDGEYTILIDYAHSPDALENVLKTVAQFAKGRVVTLFGCGGDRDSTKRPLMGEVAARLSDFVIVTSDNPRTETPSKIIEDILPGVEKHKTPYVVIEDRVEAILHAMDHHEKGDVIILAGKGHETYQEINKVKHHLDEREVIAKHIETRGKGGGKHD